MGIIDDPIKNDQEAFNDRVLDEQWSWYTDTFLSRIEEGGMQIIVMTRWSTKDLCGRLLASETATTGLSSAAAPVWMKASAGCSAPICCRGSPT